MTNSPKTRSVFLALLTGRFNVQALTFRMMSDVDSFGASGANIPCVYRRTRALTLYNTSTSSKVVIINDMSADRRLSFLCFLLAPGEY
ncbi:hypothetical protein GALMADRAFT_1201531 [Galerina marginata CBS 339.88]|uniref:Secreted protein n=1 Tax=Galerina marginata (strain CBS 339.88) TaxID=685588 RepID=A0A067TBB2_GALM3|nr:hypothetical protein GALMADRAFT_1201531 [Galerina marginata CBS 339.88]